MGRYATDSGGFQSAPLGNHLAICVRLIDLGTQKSQYGIAEKLMITFETPEEKMDDGRPFVISKILTNSLNEKAILRQWLAAWRGRDFNGDELAKFDLMNILGKPCMISVVEKDGKTIIGGIASVPKGMTVPSAHNPKQAFWIEEWDQEQFEKLSDKVREMIKNSSEYAERNNKANGQEDPTSDDMKDDIPF